MQNITLISIILICGISVIFYYKGFFAYKSSRDLKLTVINQLYRIESGIRSQVENCDNVKKCFDETFHKRPEIVPVKIETEEFLRFPEAEIRGVYYHKITDKRTVSEEDKETFNTTFSGVINSLSDLKTLNYDLNKNIEEFVKAFDALREKEKKIESVFRNNFRELLNKQKQLDYKRDLLHFFKIDRDELLKLRGSELREAAVAFITAINKCEKVDRNAEAKLAEQEMNTIYDETPKLQNELKDLRDQYLSYFVNSKTELDKIYVKLRIMSDYLLAP